MKYFLKNIFSNNKKITEGNIVKNVISLAAPLMIGALLHSTQSLIDMFWVGSLGPESIAAVAMSGIIMMLVFTIVAGIGIGAISLISKNIGAGNPEGAQLCAYQALTFGFILSLTIGICGLFFSDKFLALLGAEASVINVGSGYLKILLMGSFTMVLLLLSGSILQGSGDMINPMIFMVIANLLNIVLDPIFIFGIGIKPMYTAGAAVATILGQGIALFLALRLFSHQRSKIHLRISKIRLKLDIMMDMLRVGVPTSLQMFFRSIMSMVIINIVAGFGTAAVAAFGIVMRIHINALMPAFALGGAAATLMGQNIGAGNIERAKKSVWAATLMDMGVMFIAGFIFYNFSGTIISIFTNDPQVVAIGSEFIRISAFFYIFIAFGVVLNRALGGAGDTVVPMLITFISLWGYLVPAAYWVAKYTSFGLTGIWWVMATSYALNGLLTLVWFEIGHWKKARVTLYN
ncbi:MAG TPA: MATE family efflux transporter [Candidatus Omnitrophica bacterium]|nr:MATE family efflux transporter [Candidatus Omnitrophota bacterium]